MSDYIPLSQLPARLVRSCDGCGGTLLLDPSELSRCQASDRGNGYIYCGTCKRRTDREEVAKPVVPRARCVLRAYQGGPWAELFITEVNGDDITVGVLGAAGIEPERLTQILARWWPVHLAGRRTFKRSELYMRGL